MNRPLLDGLKPVTTVASDFSPQGMNRPLPERAEARDHRGIGLQSALSPPHFPYRAAARKIAANRIKAGRMMKKKILAQLKGRSPAMAPVQPLTTI